ncbi:MAG: ABC transporter substrate-binding protein [Mariniblastus sp.]|nr:ABC transporter substrate-binding protein [Mariniblastus sp.]
MGFRCLLLLLIAGLFGCRSEKETTTESTPGPMTVQVQLNWFPESEFGGLYEAEQNGWFKQAGLQVELLKGGPSVPAAQMVASGQVDFAVVSGPQLLTLRSQGAKVTAIFSTFQRNPRGIVVHQDSPYTSLDSLWKSSATVMGEDGLAFIKWLNREYGGQKLSFVPYTGSLAPFIGKKVDAMQCFATAEAVQLELEGVPNTVFLVADTGYNPYVTVIAVNDAFLEKHPERVSGFTSALRRGWESYLKSPAKTNQYMHGLNPDMTMEVLEKSSSRLPAFVESSDTQQHSIGWMTAQRWEELQQQLVELGQIDRQAAGKIGTPFLNPPGRDESQAGE